MQWFDSTGWPQGLRSLLNHLTKVRMNYPTQTDVASEATTYNGWTNYETWNVSLYINNEYTIYKTACYWVSERKQLGLVVSYNAFIPVLEQRFTKITPDGVSWMEPKLNTAELDEMLNELVDV